LDWRGPPEKIKDYQGNNLREPSQDLTIGRAAKKGPKKTEGGGVLGTHKTEIKARKQS